VASTLKAILYLSQPAQSLDSSRMPRDLPEIYQISRRSNLTNGISGILSFSNGVYAQVIEGETVAVDTLFAKIAIDSRHRNIQQIASVSTEKRYFRSVPLRLVSSIASDPAFRSFAKNHADKLSNLTELQAKVFSVRPKAVRDTYANTILRLRRWPDFKRIKQTPSVIEFCAHLTSGDRSYNKFTSRMSPETLKAVNRLLELFDDMGILQVQHEITTPLLKEVTPARNSFYRKMKTFLSKR